MNKNMKSIETKLLFRGSEHEFECDKFHQLCHNKGATITIIHNEYDTVYGGYISESLIDPQSVDTKITDPNTFLFVIRS